MVGLAYSPDFVAYLLTMSNKETGSLLPNIAELRYNIEHTSLVTFRDAVNAKKTEEYIAPKLCSELGKKPKIALVYGLAHAGLETCLKDSKYREDILEEFKKKDCKLVLPAQLDSIVEMNYGTEWEFEFHEAGLFIGKGY